MPSSSDVCSIAAASPLSRATLPRTSGSGSTGDRCRSPKSRCRSGSEGPAPISSAFVARFFQIEQIWRQCISVTLDPLPRVAGSLLSARPRPGA